ncbi:hypothetical protein ACIHFC_35935 [Streptomyces sp. NPDC052013]|uniref:hypothetical protein n=1 Tax=Streptomyces sp. NPDC052013 TaxID=3365679 RepID=UPI0037CDA4AA
MTSENIVKPSEAEAAMPQGMEKVVVLPKIARKVTSHGSDPGQNPLVVERTFAWLHQFKGFRFYEIRPNTTLASATSVSEPFRVR